MGLSPLPRRLTQKIVQGPEWNPRVPRTGHIGYPIMMYILLVSPLYRTNFENI